MWPYSWVYSFKTHPSGTLVLRLLLISREQRSSAGRDLKASWKYQGRENGDSLELLVGKGVCLAPPSLTPEFRTDLSQMDGRLPSVSTALSNPSVQNRSHPDGRTDGFPASPQPTPTPCYHGADSDPRVLLLLALSRLLTYLLLSSK